MGEKILIVIGVILGITAMLFLGGFLVYIVWNFFAAAFAIPYILTYWQAVAVNLLLLMISSYFSTAKISIKKDK